MNPDRGGGRIVDLTMTVSEALPAFPGSPNVHTIPWSEADRDGYNLELVAMSTHTGTHMDAPYHFEPGGERVDAILPSRLVRQAVLLRAKKRRGQNVTAEEIEALERDVQGLDSDSTLVIETQWSRSTGARYFERSPGLEPDAARLLARRGINMVCIDSPSIDPGDSESFLAHRALARAGVIVVENLCNLEGIGAPSFEIAVLPLKLKGASGAPVRALAFC